MITLRIPGLAEPKGSNRAVRGQFVPGGDSKRQARLATWHQTVVAATSLALCGRTLFPNPTWPVFVGVVFGYPLRLSDFDSAGRLRPTAPWLLTARRDVDKLLRGLLDGFTAAGVWKDDGQAQIAGAARVYRAPGQAIETVVYLGAEQERYEVVGAWSSALGEAQAAMHDAVSEANEQRAAVKRPRRKAA